MLESPLQNEKKYKSPTDQLEEELYAYSALKFDKENSDYNPKSKAKPKKSSQYKEERQDNDEQDDDDDEFSGHFRPSTKFQQQSSNQKFPSKLFKSEQDEFKDSDEFDFPTKSYEGKVNNKQKPIFASSGGKHKKGNPQLQSGFKPSIYKVREVSGPGQIKNYYNLEDNEETSGKPSKNTSPASRAQQYQQFLKAKEDERIERIVEEQFKLQHQKQIQVQKEKELQQQQQLLLVQKQKLKEAEKQLNGKATRQKRRPTQQGHSSGSRRQRNPSPLTFSGTGSQPKRTVATKDGNYRVSFNIQ